jgi:hypothetical protein
MHGTDLFINETVLFMEEEDPQATDRIWLLWNDLHTLNNDLAFVRPSYWTWRSLLGNTGVAEAPELTNTGRIAVSVLFLGP